MSENNAQAQLSQDDINNRYLVFEINSELFGVSLLDIKEVIKNTPCKPVPYMKDYFLGIINLRGRIISVIDLRLKFNKEINKEKQGFIIIVETEETQVGVLVDDIVNVQNIYKDEIDTNPHLELDFSKQFFLGVGKKGENLINLIDLSKCITKEDMRTISK
ncbi:MAG: chemotaxis protein CheW [Bacteriovoracaceae bacterium]